MYFMACEIMQIISLFGVAALHALIEGGTLSSRHISSHTQSTTLWDAEDNLFLLLYSFSY
jgi:hypothetical protein